MDWWAVRLLALVQDFGPVAVELLVPVRHRLMSGLRYCLL
jgi:hypothetical protein